MMVAGADDHRQRNRERDIFVLFVRFVVNSA